MHIQNGKRNKQMGQKTMGNPLFLLFYFLTISSFTFFHYPKRTKPSPFLFFLLLNQISSLFQAPKCWLAYCLKLPIFPTKPMTNKKRKKENSFYSPLFTLQKNQLALFSVSTQKWPASNERITNPLKLAREDLFIVIKGSTLTVLDKRKPRPAGANCSFES